MVIAALKLFSLRSVFSGVGIYDKFYFGGDDFILTQSTEHININRSLFYQFTSIKL